MGDKGVKLRGQVIDKPKEQMWMLKSESVSYLSSRWLDYHPENETFKPLQTNSFLCPQDLEEYKYTCEPGHMEWTPLNSNLTMQGIKASNFFSLERTSS